MASTVVVSDYERRYHNEPLYALAGGTTELVMLVAVISLGMAVTNAAPCKYMDGGFIATTLLRHFGHDPTSTTASAFLSGFTPLFAVNLVLFFATVLF